jgi:tetratricopeptide (TPR) repeat protein
MGHYEEAITMAKTAIDLDPLSTFLRSNLAKVLQTARRIDEAMGCLEQAIALTPDDAYSHLLLGNIYSHKGNHEEAIAKAEWATYKFGPEDRRPKAYLGAIYAAAGKRDEALAILEELERDFTQKWVSPVAIAGLLTKLNESDRGFLWLEKAYQRRDPDLPHLQNILAFDPLRDDPRYRDLMRRINLLQYQ